MHDPKVFRKKIHLHNFFRVSTDLENLEKSGKFLFLEKLGNFAKLDQKSGNFSQSYIKVIEI